MTASGKRLGDLPVQQAVRRIVRKHAAAASRALERVQGSGDGKDLHAFRVSIRRLRVTLDAYRPWLGRVAGGKPRGRLRELTRATSEARDAEVHDAWLDKEAATLGPEDRPGLLWLQARSRRRRRAARRSAGTRLQRDFARTVALLERRFARLGPEREAAFKSAFAEVLESAAGQFRTRLAAIAGPGDIESFHRARIQVKRLRYLIEPMRSYSLDARAVDQRLRKLQKLLGDIHDMHVIEAGLATDVEEAAREKARRLYLLAIEGGAARLASECRRDERLGLVRLAARSRLRRDALYAEFERNWLADRAAALDRELRGLVDSLAGDSADAPAAG